MMTMFFQGLSCPLAAHLTSPSCLTASPPLNALERMAQIVRLNDQLFDRVRTLRDQIRQAELYLDQPGSNRSLAMARLQRLKTRRSGTLAQLRANRFEAQALLARYPSS